MKKNSLITFDQPMRQSYAAILIIMFRSYRLIIRPLFPLIVIALLQGKWVKMNWVLFAVIPMAVIGAIYSVIAFFKFTFYIKDEKLIVHKGVFKKSVLEIPLDRVQSVNYQQNIIHRIFNVVKLNMDTAGSAKNEMELYALDHQKAKSLSQIILSHSQKKVEAQDKEDGFKMPQREVIFSLSLGQLIKVGITENHIRSGGIILFFFLWLFDSLREVGLDMYDEVEAMLPSAEQLARSFVVVFVLILLFALTSLIISLVRTVLKYFNLHMYRMADGFVVQSGLLNKKEHAAKDHKIQILKWSQNLLQQWAGLYHLVLKQASSVQITDKKSIQILGLNTNNIKTTQNYVFKENVEELRMMSLHKVNWYYLFRRVLYWSYFVVPVMLIFYLMGENSYILYAGVLYSYGIIASFLKYKKKKYGIGDQIIAVHGGVFGQSKEMMMLYKIQAVRLVSTPFQRRRKLSSVILYSASGAMRIPDIKSDTALMLKNYILDKIERSKKSWM